MARTRASVQPLDAYHAEIRAIEDRDFERRAAVRAAWDPGSFDGPAWYSPENLAILRELDPNWSVWYLPDSLARLRAIDRRHGVCPDDPRVYSIRAYRKEVALIKSLWQQQVAVLRGAGEDVVLGPAEQRHLARLADCKARHFPGLFPGATEEAVDTIPKLWAWAELLRDVLSIDPKNSMLRGPSWHQRQLEHLHAIYSVMHRLGVDWAPPPPYPNFNAREMIDEANRIMHRLAREEADRLRAEEEGANRLRPEGADRPRESNNTEPPAGRDGRVDRGQLPFHVERAYQSYTDAIKEHPALDGRNDRDVYKYIVENGCDRYEDNKIPKFNTWEKYVRTGRSAHGKNKNRRLAGREAGRRSIVRRQELG
jgi:hypothetical protein